MTTILVTGGNGQLASCIKDVEKQYDDLNVIYTDHLELDICNLNQIQTFFKSNPQIDYCINCAAYTAVDKAETESEKAFEINAIGAKNLAQVCNDHDAILIHVSTDFVFDGEKNEPYTETDVANPISVYGASKLQGEVEIQQALKEYFIIRTSWLYSEYGNNFMKTMLRLAETRDGISVVSDQIGTPTYTGDLAEIIIQIINTKTEKYGIYHYSNEGVASWFEFAKEIFKLTKNKTKVNPIPSIEYLTSAKRPKYSVLDKKKIIDVFKIDIPFWRDSLKKVILQGTFQ